MKRKSIVQHKSRGQALVVLLVFMVVSITITSAAVVLILVNSVSASRTEQGIETETLAESGAENALLRLLRDPNYTGETLTVALGSATVVVTGSNPKVVTSTGAAGNFVRQVQVTVDDTNNILQIQSWKAIY